jgi:ribosomal protein S12 methylthiotransferase
VDDILREAQDLVASGVNELLVVSQDTSAYGVDSRHRVGFWNGRAIRSHLVDLAGALGELGVWVRLHYVYPYPHVDELIPLMADGYILPYLDIPFQHASPAILRAMRRPAGGADIIARIRRWRALCPEIAIRSTLIVGFPGETEEDFQRLLDFVAEARLDRVGCFTYSAVPGASANALPNPVPEPVKEERRARLLELQSRISREKLAERVGQVVTVLVDEAEPGGVYGRTYADAPEVDGIVRVETTAGVAAGEFIEVEVTDSDAHDLYGAVL